MDLTTLHDGSSRGIFKLNIFGPKARTSKRKRKKKNARTTTGNVSDSSTDDGIVLDADLIQSSVVRSLDNNYKYQELLKQTIKQRRKDNVR